MAQFGKGTWISLTMVLTPDGGLTLDYNYDRETGFGLSVTANDFSLELASYPRDKELVPAWWRERIARGDA
ncbi:hypothetical protein C4K88_07530 [Arthrobacter pityocampae]|uniref:Uncharacterized protein n=1 Tax=Arthrobacter pityocampae TaxID=547334 RepID=A0A2S5IYB8_9MICC|nr:hypothetical protein C4K88_07530 [Arthrobacter pityocampae]